MNDPRFVRSAEFGSYWDYVADLSPAELRQLHERYRPLATQGIYNHEDWQKRIIPMLAELDHILESSASDVQSFHVVVFAGESGY